jgi:hypothetical protein
MRRRLLMVALFLMGMTGCPHTWGRGGVIDMAVQKDMREYLSRRRCTLDVHQWKEKCGDPESFWRRPSWERNKCPEECRPERPN